MPETRINLYLIYNSIFEQTCIELVDERIEAHGNAGSSYCFFLTKSGMTLNFEVQKVINYRSSG